jgi:hypothetical protein
MCVGKEGLVEWAKFQRWVVFMVWSFGFRVSEVGSIHGVEFRVSGFGSETGEEGGRD